MLAGFKRFSTYGLFTTSVAMAATTLSVSYKASAADSSGMVQQSWFSSQDLLDLAAATSPTQYLFVKDKPILVYKFSETSIAELPEAIAPFLDKAGTMDATEYAEDYLKKNLGGAIALQMNGDVPDFYVISKDAFQSSYTESSFDDFAAKNTKTYTGLKNYLDFDGLDESKGQFIAVLKTKKVPMIKMSDLGIAIQDQATIESPWGEQTKPAGKEAYLVYDKKRDQYYMVNVDPSGNPSNYIPAEA